MRVPFRQGIVKHQQPVFLRAFADRVELVVTDTPVILNFAHGPKDYLYEEHSSVPNAWPVTPSVDQWLYWDINTRTGDLVRGSTLIQPTTSSLEPLSPQLDQHWFDLTTKKMKVWSGGHWLEVIRLFAAKLVGGSILVSMSLNSPLYTGSQIGDNSSVLSGQILFDEQTGNALRTASGAFSTSEDDLTIGTVSRADMKLASLVIEASAQQNLAAYTVVKFLDFGKIVYANAFTALRGQIFGLITKDTMVNETTTVITHGAVTHSEWDWSAIGVNALLYCDNTGQLTPTPVIPGQVPVATVVDKRVILMGIPQTINKSTITVSPDTLDMLVDVEITNVQTADLLMFNGTQWVNGPLFVPSTIDDLSDAVITTPQASDVLVFNGTSWVNDQIFVPTMINDLSDAVVTTPQLDDLLIYNGTSWANQQLFVPSTLDDLSNVAVPAPVDGHVLTYTAGSWTSSAPQFVTHPLDDHTDVTLTSTDSGDFLSFNGSAWVNTPSLLTSPNTFTKQQSLAPVTLTDAATVVIDGSMGNNFQLQLTTLGTRTIAFPTNLMAGQVINIVIKQTVAGGEVINFDPQWKWNDDLPPYISTAAGTTTFVSAYHYSSTLISTALTGYVI